MTTTTTTPAATAAPNLSLITVVGPCWEADIEIAEMADPRRNMALRNLFLDLQPRGQAFVPGTLIALGTAKEVRIVPVPGTPVARVTRAGNATKPALDTPAAIKTALGKGEACLLLLAAEWPANATTPPATWTCLGGDIGLDALKPKADAFTSLYKAVALDPPAASDPAPQARTGAARLVGQVSVHGSGVSLLGRTALPWEPSNARLNGVFLLTSELKDPPAASPSFRVSFELERLTAAETDALIAAWSRLSVALNPRYGLNPLEFATAPAPRWATLEVVDPRAAPRMFWPIATWPAKPADFPPATGVLPPTFVRGELALLLSDQRPYDRQTPPTSLARFLPEAVVVKRDGSKLSVTFGAPPSGSSDMLAYAGKLGAGSEWSERVTLSKLDLAFDPVETARQVRGDLDMAAPVWEGPAAKQPVQPAVIWAAMALDDGWAQLPIPNVTEQIYLDALPDAKDTPARPTLLQGALVLGNSRDEALRERPGEQPWDMTLTDAEALRGEWTLRQETANAPFTLREIALTATRPSVVIDGLLWLSAERPTAANALPDLDNWVNGLYTVPLKSLRSLSPRFPPLLTVSLETLSLEAADITLPVAADAAVQGEAAEPPQLALAELGAWALELRADEALLKRLTADTVSLLPITTFGDAPLVWRRHPVHPMIQALPLTQTLSPPNYLSPSRQFGPFALPPREIDSAGKKLPVPQAWRFGVNAGEASGAAHWPKLAGEAKAAAEWAELTDLPLASLAIPGVLLDANAESGAGAVTNGLLPVQYRFDLPYTDELNALAQLPKIPRDPAQVSPLPEDPPPAPPEPLTRETFQAHWQRLSERASLASADAVTAFARQGDQTVVRGLVEPFDWPITVDPTQAEKVPVDLMHYPGGLALGNTGEAPAQHVAGEAALEGISGQFTVQGAALKRLPEGTSNPAAFELRAGSMSAALGVDTQIRDQRGLARGGSALSEQQALIATSVTLHTAANVAGTAYNLTSTMQPWELTLSDALSWQLWCRDLPVAAASSTFSRAATRSSRAEDVNDPEALSSDFNVLSGYEWRLAGARQLDDPAELLALHGLLFFPLALESLKLNGEQLAEASIAGRLQLPLPEHNEIEELGNAVLVSFTNGRISGIKALSDMIEWPLALKNGELNEAPRLRWKTIALRNDGALVISDARLHFFLFDVEWSLGLDPLVFLPNGTLASPAKVKVTTASGPLAVEAAALVLDLATGVHVATLDLLVRLGRTFVEAGAQPSRAAFTATARYTLLGEQPAGGAAWVASSVFDDLTIPVGETAALRANGLTLQFTWQQLAEPEGDPVQLLPGMRLRTPEAPGFAALSFSARAAPGDAAALTFESAFVETLLACEWGAFLQDHAGGSLAPEQVYGSSAGSVSFGYTAQWQAGTWDEAFLLNGFVEVKNLISWPLDMTFAPDTSTLTIPATRKAGASLRHVRHSMRVLLNQQAIAPELLAPGAGHLLFQLAAGQTWQFLAVAEHQLIEIAPLPSTAGTQPDPAQTLHQAGSDRRWTALQEVRLFAPTALVRLLDTYGDTAQTLDPAGGMGPLGARAAGMLGAGIRQSLRDAVAQLPADMLLVEASAPHWVSKQPLDPARATALQFLPGGSQHGILSAPDDFTPSDPQNPAWLLLTTPFLGRVQDAARDQITPAAQPGAMLQVDPVLRIGRTVANTKLDALSQALASRADADDVVLRIASMDTEAGRTWARLDPLALEENWFRISAPRPEPSSTRMQSVIAALPDGPARLSRSTALRRAFDTFRPAFPPEGARSYELPPEVSGQNLVWRPGSVLVGQHVAEQRVTRGLVAQYNFAEKTGKTIADTSSFRDPLNLTIADTKSVEWLPGGGLRVKSSARITSTGPATKIIEACQASNQITIEAWVKPAQVTLPKEGTPARIVTIATNISNRNVSLQQGEAGTEVASFYHARIRTKAGDNEGLPPVKTDVGTLKTELTHVVYTFDAAGDGRIYLNGQERAKVKIGGDFKTWAKNYQLALANELTNDRPWFGELRLVAIYSQAHTAAEVLQNYRSLTSATPAYGWHVTGALLAQALPANRAAALTRHAAVTLLPARLNMDVVRQNGETTVAEKRANPRPLSFAVSPYVGLEFRPAPAPDNMQPLLLAAELLALDPVRGALRPLASQIWEASQDAQTADALEALAQTWGAEAHAQLAPESLIGLLRLRAIHRNSDLDGTTEALLGTSFRFVLLQNQRTPPMLTQRMSRLRTRVAQLRFREGQYGGADLPTEVRPFELAPPQTAGMQPLYLREQPGTEGPGWPWGLSALRGSVRYTPGERGVAGGANGAAKTLWWQAIQQHVQFRSALHSTLPTGGLPPLFRAKALTSLLPSAPNAVLPRTPFEQEDAGRLGVWQPVLPGSLRYLLTGTRAGVMLALRHQLLRQQLGEVGPALISGSVPVQHRTPRPPAIPANAPASANRQDRALRTWASFFAPDASLAAVGSPQDEAFFAAVVAGPTIPASAARPARGLRMRLTSPERGTIDSGWDGSVTFTLTPLGGSASAADWNIELHAVAEGRSFAYSRLDGDPARFVLVAQDGEDPRSALLGRTAAGGVLALIARVRPTDATDGFAQTLVFPLRTADSARLPLPLAPAFVQFEDPEYNRRLASQAKHAAQLVVITEAGKPKPRTLTLATDRREYNPDSMLALRYDWDDSAITVAGTLTAKRIDPNGVETELTIPAPETADGASPGKLRMFSLLSLVGATSEKPPVLRPGDILQLTLTIARDPARGIENQRTVVLEVNIIADPVIPVPEAGYAVLRRVAEESAAEVECVRFAWAPNPARVELVAADDLRAEVVRRRAVFQVVDVFRQGSAPGYALQKLMLTGATHDVNDWES